MNAYIVQGIGFMAVAFFILSYQMRSNRLLFLFQLIGCSIFVVQFGILGEIALAVPENRAAEAEAVILDLDAPVEEN